MAEIDFRGPVQVPAPHDDDAPTPRSYVTDELALKADVAHTHDAAAPAAHAASHASGGTDPVTPAAIGAAGTGHTHDYAASTHAHPDLATDIELSDGLAGKADTGHAHPDLATDTELSTGLAGKADTGHVHDPAAPLAHAASHASGGTDPVSPASIGAAATTHTHGAGAITSGTLALARIPTGTTGTTVALGDHDHPATADGGYRTGLVPSDSATPVVQHGLGTDKLIAAVREASTGLYVPVAVETVDAAGVASTDWVRFSFETQPTPGQYEYIILSAAPASTATGEHTHAQAEVSGLVDAIAAKSDLGHTHPQSEVDLLADSLAAKADLAHTHAASAIASGTLALARIPTGTTGTTVALGDHDHGASAPTAHAASHGSGGSDPVTPAAIGAATSGHSHTPAAVPVAPRAASASSTYSADGTVAGDIQLTATGDTVITPTGTPNGRTMAIEVLASGATRTPSVAGSVALTSGITARSLEIPAGQIGVFVLKYSTLPSVSTWYLASAFVVG